MNEATRLKVIGAVTEILKTDNLLPPGHTVKISIEIVKPSPVVVEDLSRENDVSYLLAVAGRIPNKNNSTRMKTVIEKREMTLSMIQRLSLSDMLIFPGVGRVLLKDFKKALVEEGFYCRWMAGLE